MEASTTIRPVSVLRRLPKTSNSLVARIADNRKCGNDGADTVPARLNGVRIALRAWRNVCLPGMLSVAASCLVPYIAYADDAQVAHGKYLVQITGCTDCHTPGHLAGKPDMSRYLAGSDVGFEVPGVGTVVPRNLTPDKETGIGSWTVGQIVTAIRAGIRPDGRVLSPVMPWPGYANMTQADATAIAVYLKTLPPVKNKIPGPFNEHERPTTPRLTIVSPDRPVQVGP